MARPAARPALPPRGRQGGRYGASWPMLKFMDWLETAPGGDVAGTMGLRPALGRTGPPTGGTGCGRPGGRRPDRGPGAGCPGLGSGLIQLIGGDVIRPGIPWLLTTPARPRTADEMGRGRDPGGIAALRELRRQPPREAMFDPAVERVAVIMAAKGGLVADITVGDCLELLALPGRDRRRTDRRQPVLLPAAARRRGFPPGAPATVRMFSPVRRAAHRRAAHRPLRPGLPSRPRPARGLPARTPARLDYTTL